MLFVLKFCFFLCVLGIPSIQVLSRIHVALSYKMISKCISFSLAVCIGQVFEPHSLAVSIVSPWQDPNIIVASLYVL